MAHGAGHQSQFVKDVKSAFPQLTDAINAEADSLAFQMEVFRRFTQENIDAGDRQATLTCFDLAARYFRTGNRELRDVIDVCFVEDLNFAESSKRSRKWAWEMFPVDLQRLFSRFHGASE